MTLHPRQMVGMHMDELDTPVLVVDLEQFESNVAAMANYCRRQGVAWRPHSKSHKCPDIARIQLAAGATGLTCAKLSEAEIFAAHGVTDILLANQLASPTRLERLAQLQDGGRIIGIVDHCDALAMAAQAGQRVGIDIPLLVDVDIGMHRTGVQPGLGVLELARAVEATKGVRLLGIMGYEGHVLTEHPAAAKALAARTALDHLVCGRDALLGDSLPCEIVSAGSTGSYDLAATHDAITEIQAGGAIFMDAMYRDRFRVDERFDFALRLLTTVTGQHAGHIVTDAGFKTLSAFHNEPRVLDREDLEFGYLSAEHGIYRFAAGSTPPAIGQRLHVLPGYGDSTTVLHDHFVALREGRVERVWPLTARGALT
jgi:D-serine deaminase-like pyridoxal phosphate-dependent protein